MYRALSPTALAGTSACHRCRTPLAVGQHVWRATAGEDDRGWLCLRCGRAFAAGRPGRSAELEAMRCMRQAPIVEAVAQPAWPAVFPTAPTTSPDAHPLGVWPEPAPKPTGVRRWGRRLVLSLLVVLASGPLTATGPIGRVLAVLIGGAAAVLFWMSVVGLVVAALSGGGGSHPQPPPSRWPAGPSTGVRTGGRPAGHPTPHTGRQRVWGAEDNWVKGVQGEHAVAAALARTSVPVLHDRRLRRGSVANIDHLVVAADGVHVIDAKNLTGSLTAGSSLRVSGRDRTALLAGVRRQADEVATALARLGAPVPVHCVLCLTGTARPSGMQVAGGVLLTTPETLAVQVASSPGPLGADQRARIADLLAWAFPPAVSN